MSSILTYIRNMAPYMVYAVPAVFVFRVIAVKRLGRCHKRTTVGHEAGLWFFLIFTAGLASITIVPRGADGALSGFVGLEGFSRINLIPFRIFVDSWNALEAGNKVFPLINVAGNIVMFIPAGFFVSLLWTGDSVKKAAAAGFLFSLTVEVCQLPQARGTDIDDLWLNTLGAVAGFGVFYLMKRFRPRFVDLFRVRNM